jgi:hypothetical protein
MRADDLDVFRGIASPRQLTQSGRSLHWVWFKGSMALPEDLGLAWGLKTGRDPSTSSCSLGTRACPLD